MCFYWRKRISEECHKAWDFDVFNGAGNSINCKIFFYFSSLFFWNIFFSSTTDDSNFHFILFYVQTPMVNEVWNEIWNTSGGKRAAKKSHLKYDNNLEHSNQIMNSCEQFSRQEGKRKWKLPHNRASRRKFVWQENASKISSRWSKQENVFMLSFVVVLKGSLSFGWWRWDWVRLDWDENWMSRRDTKLKISNTEGDAGGKNGKLNEVKICFCDDEQWGLEI